MSIKRYEANGSSSIFEDANGSLVDYEDYSVLEKKLTDMAVQLANAESKCRELAAENAWLNVFIEEECFVYSSDTPEPIDANDCKPETPSTDAFLAEVRAQGVDLVCDYHKSRCEALHDVDRNGSQRHGAALCDAIDIAAKIREGVKS